MAKPRTRNAMLIQTYETARNWMSENTSSGYREGYQVGKEEAFQKILPKNIRPEKLRTWRMVLGLDTRGIKL